MTRKITVELEPTLADKLAREAAENSLTIEELAAAVLISHAKSADKAVLELADEVLDDFSALHQRLA